MAQGQLGTGLTGSVAGVAVQVESLPGGAGQLQGEVVVASLTVRLGEEPERLGLGPAVPTSRCMRRASVRRSMASSSRPSSA